MTSRHVPREGGREAPVCPVPSLPSVHPSIQPASQPSIHVCMCACVHVRVREFMA